MRGRMNDTKSYIQPYALDEPLKGHIVGKYNNQTMNNFQWEIMLQVFYRGEELIQSLESQ